MQRVWGIKSESRCSLVQLAKITVYEAKALENLEKIKKTFVNHGYKFLIALASYDF